MHIDDQDPSVTEHVMQGVVDLRASSMVLVEEGFHSASLGLLTALFSIGYLRCMLLLWCKLSIYRE